MSKVADASEAGRTYPLRRRYRGPAVVALADVGQSVRASGDSLMLMVGDFNATWGNKGFVALLHDGVAARGKATDMTWPNSAVVPPFVRIDHVLTGARLAVTQIAAKPGFGSDHRYLVATVAI